MLRHGIPSYVRTGVKRNLSCSIWEMAVRETMTKGKRICSAAGLLLILSLVEGAGICQYQYRNSVPYRYEKAVERADACYAEEKWQEAYEAYAEALSYESGDGRVLRRAVLSNLERVKESGNPRHLIQT